MGSAWVGVIFALLILVGSIFETLGGFGFFIKDIAGIMIVIGGTLAVALTTFSFKDVLSLGGIFVLVFRKHTDDSKMLVLEIVELARETRGEPRAIQEAMSNVKYSFLREGLALLVERFESSRIEGIMKDRIRAAQDHHDHKSNMLKTLGKYPPALGIVGTVLGIIALLQKLDPKNKGNIGPAMAVGLVATFYGLVLTNFVLVPMGENLAIKAQIEIRKMQIAMVGVLLLRNGESAVFVQEVLNSYLPPNGRVDVFSVGSGAEAGGNAA